MIEKLKIYQKDGKDCLLCLCRKKLIQITPEEIVRQDTIKTLVKDYNVPIEMIDVEVPLSYYEKGKKGRVDIIVSGYDSDNNSKIPLMLIECKAPDVPLVDKVFEQAASYDACLGTKVIVLLNGDEVLIFYWDEEDERYWALEKIPQYNELLKDEGIVLKTEFDEIPKRINHKDDIKQNRKLLLENGNIGEDTDLKFVSLISNLVGLINDEEDIVTELNLKTRFFVSDGGLRFTTFGNASGGTYPGLYRYFILEKDKNTELVSFSLMGNGSFKDDPKYGNRKGNTPFIFAIDDFENSHNSIEYSIDKYVNIEGDEYSFWHDGTLTNGKKGACKRQNVIDYIKDRVPNLIKDNKVFLGNIDNTFAFTWDNKNIRTLFANFIDYAFLRDEFRKTL